MIVNMKKIFSLLILTLICALAPSLALAQDTGTEPVSDEFAVTSDSATDEDNLKEEAIIEAVPLQAQAGQDKRAAVGRSVEFSGSASTGPSDVEIKYSWDFGDGQAFEGIDASHIYNEPGTYKASLTITAGEEQSKDQVLVSVAKDVVILITDNTIAKDQIKQYREYAQQKGTLVVVYKPKNKDDPDYALSRNIAEQLITSEQDLDQANLVIVWTEKNIGLNALSEIGRIFSASDGDVSTSSISFSQKAIVRIDEELAGSILTRLAQSTYNIIDPKYVLLTTTEAFPTLLSNPDTNTLIDSLKSEQIDYQIIGSHSQRVLGKVTPFNFVSYGINYLINQGVSQDSLFLLLILPIVATIIAFGRQIVGLKAFGIYVPSIITLTFVVTKIKYGLVIFVVLLFTATIARIIAKRLRLLYLPRMAIVLTVVAFAIFFMLIAASYFDKGSFLALSIFPILVMIILTEKFVEAQIEQGQKTAIILTLETLFLALVSYYIVTWNTFETFIMAYPEVILLTLVLNIILGRFTGLRLREYFRFRKLFKKSAK